MWKRCLTKADRDEFFALQTTNVAYKDFTREELDNTRGKKGGVFYIYDGGTFKITLSFKYTYSLDKWRVLHNMPSGGYQIDEAAKITFRKIREFMDEHGVVDFYAITLPSYTPRKLDNFFNLYPSITWELTERFDDGLRIWDWHRDPARISEDELWHT